MNDLIFWGSDYQAFLEEAEDLNITKSLVKTNEAGEFMFLSRISSSDKDALSSLTSVNLLGGYDEVFSDSSKLSIYNRIYDQTPIEIEDEEGNISTYTPPQKFAEFGGVPPAQTKQEKEEKIKLLSEITVTTSQGNTFDGDDVARSDMMSAITSSDTLGQTQTSWKMADNTWATVGISEMREALALAIQRKGEILNG